jgi:hypothetical protein
VVDPRTFIVEDRGLLWAPKIAVVLRTTGSRDRMQIAEDQDVVVTGLVRSRITPDLRRELAAELTPEALAALGDGPVLIARSIRRHDR